MTQLLLILRQKEHCPLLHFFCTKLNATHTPDIEPINVAYLGAARSYNVSKKRVYFHAFIQQIYYFSLTTVMARIVMLQRIKLTESCTE